MIHVRASAFLKLVIQVVAKKNRGLSKRAVLLIPRFHLGSDACRLGPSRPERFQGVCPNRWTRCWGWTKCPRIPLQFGGYVFRCRSRQIAQILTQLHPVPLICRRSYSCRSGVATCLLTFYMSSQQRGRNKATIYGAVHSTMPPAILASKGSRLVAAPHALWPSRHLRVRLLWFPVLVAWNLLVKLRE